MHCVYAISGSELAFGATCERACYKEGSREVVCYAAGSSEVVHDAMRCALVR